MHVGATAVCQVRIPTGSAGIGGQINVLYGLAVIRATQWIETRVGAEMITALLDQRDRRNELILIAQYARKCRHRAVIHVVRQGRGELAAIIGRELRIAYTVAVAV